MRVLFICDFFPPFSKGGGEISAYWQAKKLTQKGLKIVVLTPCYKDKVEIEKENFKNYWYPLPIRPTSTSPIIFLNPLFFIYLFYHIVKVAKKEEVDLIHCQGKYSMPAAALAKAVLKVPLFLTLRDYRGICNHGFCLYKGKKGCNLLSFFKKDFLFYYQHYIEKKDIFSFLTQLVFSYFGRLNTFVLAFFMKKADKFVCVSNYVANVYFNNGYDKKKMVTIYNPVPMVKIDRTEIPKEIKTKINKHRYAILYAGKLSLGKGANLLINAAKEIINKRNDVLFIFAGKMYYPIKKIKSEQLLFLNQVNPNLLLKIMSLVDIVCIPSIWPEPLSRVAIEALFLGKPILSSNVGGLKELVSNKNGWLFKPNKKDLTIKINEALKDRQKLKNLGQSSERTLIKLEKKQENRLISLYQSI